jgi:3-mercaptopyruvate sulfurtransferase SseA
MKKEKELTAVEWLVEQIKKDPNLRLRGFDIDGIAQQAKEMEKEQIIDAVYYNTSATRHDDLPKGEQYYKDTFK